MEWSGVECSGVEWSGVEWSGVDWSGLEWTGVDWSGLEWSGGPRRREVRVRVLGLGFSDALDEWLVGNVRGRAVDV